MKANRFINALTIIGLMLLTFTVSEASTRARFRAETVVYDASVRISAGAFHTCRVNGDGTVRCWGLNDRGQLGDGSGSIQVSPVQVSGITSAIAVSAGGVHTCALLTDGTVRCWGDNFFGQLGDNTATNRFTPVTVIGLANVVAISGGKEHTCAVLATGGARCWGNNGEGRLGDLSTQTRRTPVTVLNVNGTAMGNVVAISAGGEHTCALFAVGTARCWGNSAGGRLGITTPGGPVSGLTNAVAIAAGGDFSCALITGGFVSCWGNNSLGQLGNNTTQSFPIPGLVAGLPSVVSIAAGTAHACVIVGDGGARCWGSNLFGEVGDGVFGGSRLTSAPVTGLNGAVAITADNGLFGGSGHTCALLADGSTRCWGQNAGQLGNGTTTASATPVVVLGGGGGISARAIAAGRNHTCALRANSTVSCWGSNASGQLGDGTTGVNRLTPVAIAGLSNVTAIAAGEAHTCALLADGSVRCWGDNSSGQLGDGTLAPKSTPVPVPGLFRIVAIAAGGTLGSSHTCALSAEGGVFCWGANGSGQLGDGTNTHRPIPVLVSNLVNVVTIAVGELYSCALLANGTARCWGANNTGQLGDGTGAAKSAPVAVIGLPNAVVSLAAGNTHACALLADGSSRCWGGNLLGQLGDGTTITMFVPTTVSGLANAVANAGGFGHTCAIVSSGNVRCWGDNSTGQLGNATTTSSRTPVAVGTVLNGIGVSFFRQIGGVVHITTGRRHSCVVFSNGGVSCWGENTSGQLGNGSITNSSVPFGVSSFTLNIDPAVTVESNTRVATVTIIAGCDAGQWLFVEVKLSQGTTSGIGVGAGECTGGLTRYPVTTVALGRNHFVQGAATVEAKALILGRGSIDTEEWTRAVQILIPGSR